jgi:hypothetical protein
MLDQGREVRASLDQDVVEMTPAERKVIEAARAWIATLPADLPDSTAPLLRALVDAVRAPASPTTAEVEATWGLVVAEDEIWNEKTKRWYPVEKVWRAGANVEAVLTGPGRIPSRPASRAVRVRRSAMGRAVDVWCEVLASS